MAKFLHNSKSFFARFANRTARATGHYTTFIAALSVIIVWGVTGPLFNFSDTWQLAINTSTTIITFLMVFLIQNTQNRESEAMQIKLDEIIRAIEGAHNALLDLEDLTETELDLIRKRYTSLAQRARADLKKGNRDTNRPVLDEF